MKSVVITLIYLLPIGTLFISIIAGILLTLNLNRFQKNKLNSDT